MPTWNEPVSNQSLSVQCLLVLEQDRNKYGNDRNRSRESEATRSTIWYNPPSHTIQFKSCGLITSSYHSELRDLSLSFLFLSCFGRDNMLPASIDSKGIINIISFLHHIIQNSLFFSCLPAGVTSFLKVCFHDGLAFIRLWLLQLIICQVWNNQKIP